jgi:hypothetical protein
MPVNCIRHAAFIQVFKNSFLDFIFPDAKFLSRECPGFPETLTDLKEDRPRNGMLLFILVFHRA